MREIHVDGQPFAAGQGAGTYGELLAVLDPAMAGQSRIVTALRVNGVEEPAFREDAARARTLAPGDRVEVGTRPVQALAHDALADSVRLMPAVAEAATQLGEQLARSAAPDDATALAELAEGLTLLVTLVQAAESWADAARVPRADWLGQHVAEVGRCIDAVNEAQHNGDWVTVADALTYDLAPALEQWRAHLTHALQTFADGALGLSADGGGNAHAPER